MKDGAKNTDVRFRLSENDVQRLDEQCRRFEWTRSELLRYYIRAGYDSMADLTPVDHASQAQLWAVTQPSGARLRTPPLPKGPKREPR